MNRGDPYFNYYKFHPFSTHYMVTIYYTGSGEDENELDLDVAFIDFRYYADQKKIEYLSSTAPLSKDITDPFNYNVITSKEYLEKLLSFMIDNELGEYMDCNPVEQPYMSIRYSDLIKLFEEEKQKMCESKHWIDNADSYLCPVCGFEARPNPAKYKDCKCPRCGFQDEKDKEYDPNPNDSIPRREVLQLLARSIGKSNTYIQTEIMKIKSVSLKNDKLEQIKEIINEPSIMPEGAYPKLEKIKKRLNETDYNTDGE